MPSFTALSAPCAHRVVDRAPRCPRHSRIVTAPSAYTPADRTLERSLLFNFFVHAIALVSMVLFLLPALPGGVATSDSARIAYIAAHPWAFRIGWFPWQLCAV